MPRTMAAIDITVDTPITTPRIVSAERSLLVRRASNANAMFSRSWSRSLIAAALGLELLGSEGRDGVEACRPARRVHAEHDADRAAQRERDEHRPVADAC